MYIAVMDQTIVVSYLVATTFAAPVYGRLGDSFGRRRLMFIAIVIFVAASLCCAMSGSIEALSASRVLQGLGGGGLMTLSQALIGETIPARERGRFQGYLAAVVVSSSAFGPVAGGFLTEQFGWRSIFLVSAPLGALAFLLALRLPVRAGIGHPGRFDGFGLLCLIAFVAPLLLALEQLQRLDPAGLPRVAALGAIAIISLLLLIRREKRAKVPLLPIALLRQPTVWRSDALAACHGAALVSLTTFIPIYLRVVRGASPAESGLLLLPVTIGIGTGSVITGRLVTKTGYTAIFPSCGLLIATLAIVFLAFRAPYLDMGQLALTLGFTALFMGSVMGVVQITIQHAAGRDNLGAAAASVQLSRSIGAAFGTALVGAVLFAVFFAEGGDAPKMFGLLMQDGPAALTPLQPSARASLQSVIAEGFQAAFLTIAGFAAFGVILAWSIPSRRI